MPFHNKQIRPLGGFVCLPKDLHEVSNSGFSLERVDFCELLK